MLNSFSLTYVQLRTVIFTLYQTLTLSHFLSYIPDINSYSYVSSYFEFHGYSPYIIFSFSPTYVQTYFIFEMTRSTKISPEKLIGIVCGSVAVFFIILSIIIFIIRKRNIEIEFINSDISSDSSSYEEESKETFVGVNYISNAIKSDDSWI